MKVLTVAASQKEQKTLLVAEEAACGFMPEGTEDAAYISRCCLWLHTRRNRRRCW